MSETLAEFTDQVGSLFMGGAVDSLVTTGTTVAIFITGAIIGLFTVSRLVDYSLHHAPEATLVFLVSLVVGALRAPVAEIGSKGIGWTVETTGGFALAAFVGAAILYTLDHYAMDVEIDSEVAGNRRD